MDILRLEVKPTQLMVNYMAVIVCSHLCVFDKLWVFCFLLFSHLIIEAVVLKYGRIFCQCLGSSFMGLWRVNGVVYFRYM